MRPSPTRSARPAGVLRPAAAAAGLALALAAVPTAALAQVTDGDFSAGLAGWDTAGDASVLPVDAAQPTRLWLTTASTDFADDADAGLAAGARNVSGVAAVGTGMPGGLESFAGLAPGALDPSPATGIVAWEGSAARQTFDAVAGTTLRFRWDLGTLDGVQPDLAFVVIDGRATTLADLTAATQPGTDGNAAGTGWQDFGFTFLSSGEHTVVFGVADVGDFDGTSTLAVADVRVTPVPEPASALLMALGLGIGLAGISRRRAAR